MHAVPGDWMVIKGTVVDEPDQVGLIREVHSEDGGPPYLVRWMNDDHETLVFPGPDAYVVPEASKTSSDEHERRRYAELQEVVAARQAHAHTHPSG
ncbi:DUF1918 domain-containing protein [Rhodococcus kronopolitis]|uniref:DUF1918 domain-containing protein n=1 Tax=Rhodococcus kronopolitis TaxID=1460226 RepID=A0ABV9FRD3_9NOCA